VSVGSNIFEGCGRQSSKSLVAFLYIAYGSAGELVFQTRLAERRRYGEPSLAKDVEDRLVTNPTKALEVDSLSRTKAIVSPCHAVPSHSSERSEAPPVGAPRRQPHSEAATPQPPPPA
jgi:hypothetical protein